jgi:micrococcal nuclease
MIFFKNHINNYPEKFINDCFKKTSIHFKLFALKKTLLIILLIAATLSQVSCGFFYVENAKKINSGEISSNNSGFPETSGDNSGLNSDDSMQSSGNSGTAGSSNINSFENENFTDPSFIVSMVIDGDTIELKNNMRLRLIGINTPEKDMYFYEESKGFLELLVLGKQVKLERDVTDKDMYGRHLRYVYLPDIFINLEMVKSGFANAYTYPPDVKYTDMFVEAERLARESNAGLWQKSFSETLEIVLNYDAEGPDTENLNGEWAAIKNCGLKTLNLHDWTLKDAGTNIYKFDNYELKPGETLFLHTGSGKDGAEKLYWNSATPVWNNKHDTLYIRNSEGLLVYLFNY